MNKKAENFLWFWDKIKIKFKFFLFKIKQRYVIFGWFLSDIIVFILVIVFGAMDFYCVKNITGRILVGLRLIY